MKKRNSLKFGAGIVTLIILISLIIFFINGNKITKANCLAEDCLSVGDLNYPVGELPAEVKDTLDLAINDEYKAHAFYEKVIEKFGSIRPFSMIVRSEEQHISSLKAIYDKYGIEIPEDTWADNLSAPETIQESCQAGVAAEIENAALYREKLLPAVKDYEDITLTYNSLMSASEEKHLLAFQKCA